MKKQKSGSTSYKCEKCRDLTFIINDNEATPCECRSLREAEAILKHSGISSEFREKTFDNFDYTREMDLFNAFSKAKVYINESEGKTPSRSIMFLGQVGSGKTHLSMAVANKLMDNGVGVLYMSYRDSIMRLKQNIMDEGYYQREVLKFKKARVLLIDDLFKGSVSGSDLSVMYEILDYRYFNGLPVIVSCEKLVEDLLRVDEAVGSRLLEMSRGFVVELKGRKLNYRIYG